MSVGARPMVEQGRSRRLRTTALPARPLARRPSVTVIITCFNYADYLPVAVRSALDQEGVDVDVIVVDDASTDGSDQVARDLARDDERVRVWVNDVNRGPVGTFNRGLAEASGEFLVRLDADDLLTPGSLQRSVAVMDALPQVGLVYGHPLHFSGSVLPRPRLRASRWLVWSGAEWLAARCASGDNVITSPEAVMRRSVVDRVGGQSDLAHTHDMEMWLRISAYADVAYIQGADQAWHREHAASLSTRADDPLSMLREARDAFTVLFERVGDDLAEDAELQRLAMRSLAGQAAERARGLVERGETDSRARELTEFAVGCAPNLPEIAASVRRPRPPKPIVLLRRIRRRLRQDARWRRWHRSGVYEPLRKVSPSRR